MQFWTFFKPIISVINGGGVEDTGQGQGPKKISRPRTDPLEAKAKNQGHRRKCSPKKKVLRKFFQVISKKKVFKKFFYAKKVFTKFFSGDFHLRKTKKGLRKFSTRFLALSNKTLTVQKIVLSLSRGQGNFRGLEAKVKDFKMCPRGLHL